MGISFSGNSGNSCNSGNSGNSGNAGNASGGSNGWYFADRVDLPFVTLLDPITGNPIAGQRLGPDFFPERCWSADWFAWLALAEYVNANTWQGLTPPTWNPANVQSELDELVIAARDERADALGEILGQSDEFITYFMDLMGIRPTSHPATTRVMHIASLVGLFTVMYCKGEYDDGSVNPVKRPRPRPSQLCPALCPPIAVPGHASWPSGHATQSQLIALCMLDVVPTASKGVWEADLRTLAWRIARNREIAGLHYPSDSDAGRQLATNIHQELTKLPGVTLPLPANQPPPPPYYSYAIAMAQAEWA